MAIAESLNKLKKIACVLAAIALLIALFASGAWYQSRPSYKVQQFAAALQAQDWHLIYDLGAPTQQEMLQISRSQFATMMRRLCFGTTFTRSGDPFQSHERLRTRMYFRFSIDINNGSHRRSEYDVMVRHYDGKWYPDLNLVPIYVNKLIELDQSARRLKLLDAMKIADVKAVIDLDNGLQLKREILALVIAGQLPAEEIWQK